MKISEHFDLREVVTPEAYAALGDKAIILMDKRIIDVCEELRNYFDEPITINNWHSGGQYHESGLRNFDTTTGAKYSQHKYGRALDLKFTHVTPEEVRNEIREMFDHFSKFGLTTIEQSTATWVHIDCRFTGLTTLLEVPYQ